MARVNGVNALDRAIWDLEKAIRDVETASKPHRKAGRKQATEPLAKEGVNANPYRPVTSIVANAERLQKSKVTVAAFSPRQRIALSVGLRVDYPGLESMSKEDMRKAAAIERAEAIRHIARAAGTEYKLDAHIAEIRRS